MNFLVRHFVRSVRAFRRLSQAPESRFMALEKNHTHLTSALMSSQVGEFRSSASRNLPSDAKPSTRVSFRLLQKRATELRMLRVAQNAEPDGWSCCITGYIGEI